jgi:hypothetical protein
MCQNEAKRRNKKIILESLFFLNNTKIVIPTQTGIKDNKIKNIKNI